MKSSAIERNALLLAYRLYFALKRVALRATPYRWARAAGKLKKFTRYVKHKSLHGRKLWLQVESGLSKGMWMHLEIPDGAAFWRGEHEREVQNLILAIVQPGNCVYDVGAHFGFIALGMARLVRESGSVVAFEGDPENTLRLEEHRLKNELQSHLQVVHAAVWSHGGEDGISFRRGEGSSYGGVEADGQRPVLAHGEIIRIPVLSLDDFITAGGRPPQLIKIDVEGGESEVLRGGRNLFANQRPLLIVEVHHQKAAEEILTWLENSFYSAEWHMLSDEFIFPKRLLAWPTDRSPCPFPRI